MEQKDQEENEEMPELERAINVKTKLEMDIRPCAKRARTGQPASLLPVVFVPVTVVHAIPCHHFRAYQRLRQISQIGQLQQMTQQMQAKSAMHEIKVKRAAMSANLEKGATMVSPFQTSYVSRAEEIELLFASRALFERFHVARTAIYARFQRKVEEMFRHPAMCPGLDNDLELGVKMAIVSARVEEKTQFLNLLSANGLPRTDTEEARGSRLRSERGSKRRGFDANHTRVLRDWYDTHLDSPYPSSEEKAQMAQLTNLSRYQVTRWFGNVRTRKQPKEKPVDTDVAAFSALITLSVQNRAREHYANAIAIKAETAHRRAHTNSMMAHSHSHSHSHSLTPISAASSTSVGFFNFNVQEQDLTKDMPPLCD